MTHTLHRHGPPESFENDYVLISMAAQRVNSEGSTPYLEGTFRILMNSKAVNYADDNTGGILTGFTNEQMLAGINEKSYPGAAFASEADLEEVLIVLRDAQLRMPVVVRGDYKRIFAICERIGLKPHTVHLALGIYGKKELLPKDKELQITTMCGHGMVCADHVKLVASKVKARTMTPEEAGRDLARPCTCGIFNPVRAADIVSAIAEEAAGGK
jgi:hypothetical protein